ncbi:molybdopterin-guanine dinucleotide biosynthesis protein B [Candidatus Bipolaricaulota bacterium]|nr:molybdopterin-guanine dinucleotide biosynthesis protein B [Candidatus Bipolaricaulota bacterium]
MREIGPPAVGIVGWHNSGKTRLVVQLTKILCEYGFRVATIKHAADLQDLEDPGSDSAKHQAAGACETLLIGENRSALYRRLESRHAEEIPFDLLSGGKIDVVLVEGFKGGSLPKIETYRRSDRVTAPPLAGEIDVLAVVTDEHIALPDGVRVFRWRDVESVADLIVDGIIGESGSDRDEGRGRTAYGEGRAT